MIQTLADILPVFEQLRDKEALRFHNGFRTWTYSYHEVYERLSAFAHSLQQRTIKKGDRLLLWGDNGAEWVICFWGAVVRGVEVIPIDPASSVELIARICSRTNPSLLVCSDRLKTDFNRLPTVSFSDIWELPATPSPPVVAIDPQDIVEIVFTSGTTGEPKGVVHRHRNLCANLRPFQKEIERYRYLARPFQPIRILNLLPLSHMFGQSLGLFIPLLLRGSSVFTTDLHPASIADTIRRERISVLGTVPRILSQLQSFLEEEVDTSPRPIRLRGIPGVAERWWRFRSVHSRLGWKFWAVVSGGAQVPSEIEEFWSRIGILLIQGYGLTEASPIVSVNHPFRARKGSIGQVVEGQEVRIAPDGEILVRGESIARDYFDGNRENPAAHPGDEWLHTGDIGAFDSEGNLIFKGRKKDAIVTADGLNVYPEDVESVLLENPEIESCAVVGLTSNGREQVHAVLIPRSSVFHSEYGALADQLERVIRSTNRKLEPHQRIKGWTLWPEPDFPRTSSTMKIKRFEVTRRLKELKGRTKKEPAEAAAPGSSDIVARIVGDLSGQDPQRLVPDLRLAEDIGLNSLDRIELLSRLERAFNVRLDESQFARFETLGELAQWLQQPAFGRPVHNGEKTIRRAVEEPAGKKPEGNGEPVSAAASPGAARNSKQFAPPRWNRLLPVRLFRFAALHTVILPLFRHYLPLTVHGVEHFAALRTPVLFAANHSSHLDTPALLAALPRRWRSKVAPAMVQERFQAYFAPAGHPLRDRYTSGLHYFLACALFNAYPLPQRMGGIRSFLQYTGELVDRGFSPVIFPEGRRTPDGRLLPFKPGVGLMAVRLQIPVVPVFIRGLFEVFSLHDDWPKPGPVKVFFGKALRLHGEDHEKATRKIEQAVRALM